MISPLNNGASASGRLPSASGAAKSAARAGGASGASGEDQFVKATEAVDLQAALSRLSETPSSEDLNRLEAAAQKLSEGFFHSSEGIAALAEKMVDASEL